jgi:hypothetical protein
MAVVFAAVKLLDQEEDRGGGLVADFAGGTHSFTPFAARLARASSIPQQPYSFKMA